MSVERTDLEYERTRVEPATQMDLAIISATAKAELDQQIVTAKANPRSLRRFVTDCMDMACLSEAVASECYYVLPRAGKKLEGPSVRLAEIVQYAWGNCQSGSRVVDEGEEFVTAQGVFYDMEKNVRVWADVKRRITDSQGRRYNADMIGVTGNAACSIAFRNAVFRGIPKAFWNDIYLAAKRCAAGNIKSLVTNRTEALAYLARKGITEPTVLAAVGVAGIEDIGLDELALIRGMITAIKEEGVSVEDAFAPKDGAPAVGKPKTAAPKSKATAKPEPEPEVDEVVEREPGEDDEPPPPKRVSARTQDASPVINSSQLAKLEAKASAEGVDLADLCNHFHVGRLALLPVHQYAAAYTWLGTHAGA